MIYDPLELKFHTPNISKGSKTKKQKKMGSKVERKRESSKISQFESIRPKVTALCTKLDPFD